MEYFNSEYAVFLQHHIMCNDFSFYDCKKLEQEGTEFWSKKISDEWFIVYRNEELQRVLVVAQLNIK